MYGLVRGVGDVGAATVKGTKVAEVDPRSRPERVFGIGERPRRIAQGVLLCIGGSAIVA